MSARRKGRERVGPRADASPAGEGPRRGPAPPAGARAGHPPPAARSDPRRRAQGEPEASEAPPLHAKVHPPAEMGNMRPTLDDSVRSYHHHPSEAGVTDFGFDPEAADAAADLAGDLGAQFLEGATLGEDVSDVAMSHDDREEESDTPLLLEDEDELSTERPLDPALPSPGPHRRRARHARRA